MRPKLSPLGIVCLLTTTALALTVVTRAKNFSAFIACSLMLCSGPVWCQTLDSFNPNGANVYGGASVNGLGVQPDGKILLTGGFGLIGGLNRSDIARVNSDGSLDPDFNPEAYSGVGPFAVQTDGKIIVGGSFTAMGDLSHTNLARLNTSSAQYKRHSGYIV
jgi:hypothetical protein